LRRVEGLLLRFQSRQDGFQTELERVQERVRALELALVPAAPVSAGGQAPGVLPTPGPGATG
jgi:hypothetical protein